MNQNKEDKNPGQQTLNPVAPLLASRERGSLLLSWLEIYHFMLS
jgi:hypothetical protein